jgi:hypothetical protein
VVISGRWPNEPPAWREGIAIPWLSGGKPNFDAATRRSEDGTLVTTNSAQQPGVDYTPRRKKKKTR